MIITHTNGHRWVKAVTQDPFSDFGRNTQARLRSTLKKIELYSVTYEIKELDEEFLSWFIPLYEARINEKSNPRVFDIRKKTLYRRVPKQYYSLVLKEAGIPIGGTVFSLSDDTLSIAYRTIANNWTQAELQANPSSYTEYVISLYAASLNKKFIVHGKDRNPYGLYSSIGLANFKLSAGCSPEKPKKFKMMTTDTDTLTVDVLILEYPKDSSDQITKGYLIASKESIEKWTQVTKYPSSLQVDIIPRSINV